MQQHLSFQDKYDLHGEGRQLDTAGMVDMWAAFCNQYPIVSVEDPLDEDDWQGFVDLTERIGRGQGCG